mmetsp:Transcript_1895/g.2731  ORF Transcript_1895/g.2731 Transcript_1895/m.2731 type:complete len:764 (+) Transcript_1895:142-2433(+)
MVSTRSKRYQTPTKPKIERKRKRSTSLKEKKDHEPPKKLKKKKPSNTISSSKQERLNKRQTPKKPHKTKKNNMIMHQVTFNSYYKASGIRSVARHPKLPLVAVARENAAIEIWYSPSTLKEWTLFKRLAPPKKQSKITKMIFRKHYLYVSSLDSYITKWDFVKGIPKVETHSYGGAVWDMDIDKDRLACACEDGKVRVYDVKQLDFDYSLTTSYLEKPPSKYAVHCHGNRLHTVKFMKAGTRLVTGGFTGVHAFDVKHKICEFHIKLHEGMGIVWDVMELSDDLFAFCDAEGYVYFVDNEYGNIINRLHKHKYDVMALALSPSKKRLVSVGVDGQVVLYEFIDTGRWVISHANRPSYHDLYDCQFITDSVVMVGGLDSRLSLVLLDASEKPFIYHNHEPMNSIFDVYHANQSSYVLSHNNESDLHLFQIAHVSPKLDELSSVSHGAPISFSSTPKQLLHIETKSHAHYGVVSCAIHASGKYIAYCTLDSIVLLTLSWDSSMIPVVSETHYLDDVFVDGAHAVRFTNSHLVAINRDGRKLYTYHLATQKVRRLKCHFDDFSIEHTSPLRELFHKSVMSLVTSSHLDEKVIVCFGDFVHVFDLDLSSSSSSFSPLHSFSIAKGVVYEAGLIQHQPNLFYVLSTDQHVSIFDLEKHCRPVLSSGFVQLSNHPRLKGGIKQIIRLDLGREGLLHSMIFSTPKSFYEFNGSSVVYRQLQRSEKMYSLLGTVPLPLSSFSSPQWLVLKHMWQLYQLDLPPVVYRHRFGT